MYFVYILKSEKDGSHYVGQTRNLKQRLQQHNDKRTKYTSAKAPYKLIWYGSFLNKELAFSFEKYLKSSSGFAFRNKHLI